VHLIIFQFVVGPVLAVVCAISVVRMVRGRNRRPAALAAFVWLCALLAVLRPDLTMLIARFMGIGRGTDLVLYLFVIAFLGAAFYFYNRMMLLEASLTRLTRHIALREAAVSMHVGDSVLQQGVKPSHRDMQPAGSVSGSGESDR
jgi:hypothetical protein